MKTLRALGIVTAAFAYAVIVIGFIVRITGSGMGCGDAWPLCNGRVIPSFQDPHTLVEFGHRLAVLGLTVLVVALAVVAWARRGQSGGSGPRGTLRPALAALGLLMLQSVLGALAVKLELSPHTVVLHLGIGLGLLATLVVLSLRAGVHAGITAPQLGVDRGTGGVVAAAVLAAIVVLMGGLTATSGASWACQGFPLCSGALWPPSGSGGLAMIQWTHRLLAYLLFFHLLGLAMAFQRRHAAPRARIAMWTAFAFAFAQVAAGATMVLTHVPPIWRATHAVLGTGVWVVVVYAAWLVRRPTAAIPGGLAG
jgi:cytochrome c oxidase assembly protein subunit 15